MPQSSDHIELVGVSCNFEQHLQTLVRHDVVERIFRKDMSVLQDLGVDSQMPQASLHWTDAHDRAVSEVDKLCPPSETTHICLIGMGGASLSARVYALFADAHNDRSFEVVDSIAPSFVADVIVRTQSLNQLCIVSSKSGGTVETFDMARTLHKAVKKRDAVNSFWVVTDPSDSPLGDWATTNNIKVIFSDPDVQGRYSATSVLGLIGARALNLDISEIHRTCKNYASQMKNKDSCESSFARSFASALAHACETESSELIVSGQRRLLPVMQWTEQLVAESLGKSDKGVLPVIRTMDEGQVGFDVMVIEFRHPDGHARYRFEFSVTDLSAVVRMFLALETAVFVAGCLIDVNPLDQGDVELSKQITRQSLTCSAKDNRDGEQNLPQVAFTTPANENRLLSHMLETLKAACSSNLGYTAILAYLAPTEPNRSALEKLSEALEQATKRTAVYQFGPQYLHSTGQFHKGGPPHGVFVFLLVETDTQPKVEGRTYSFGELLTQQARADAHVLKMKGREVFVLTLSESVVSDLEELAAEISR